MLPETWPPWVPVCFHTRRWRGDSSLSPTGLTLSRWTPDTGHWTLDTGHWTLVLLIDQIYHFQANFDPNFWVGSKQGAEVEPQPHLVNRTQMYKVTTSSSATTL